MHTIGHFSLSDLCTAHRAAAPSTTFKLRRKPWLRNFCIASLGVACKLLKVDAAVVNS
jgi:hypothetical protein